MLQSLLAEGRPLLADGATGTNLFAMGLAAGETPELWNATTPTGSGAAPSLRRRRLRHHPDQQFRRQPAPAGAARARCAHAGAQLLAAQNARAIAGKAGRRVVIAGSVGPTGDILAPLGPLSEDDAVEVFVEQIEGLREGGADVVWIETMSAADEIRAAARAAARPACPTSSPRASTPPAAR